MVWRRNSYGQDQNLDGSLGLVMRLAVLWTKVDTAASEGRYDQWNALLDRVWANLSYQEELNATEEDGKIIDVTLSLKDKQLWTKLNSKIVVAKKKLAEAKKKEEYHQARDNLYKAMLLKDVGLRKFHHNTLGTYTKEVTKNPARSMWGG